MAVLVPIVFKAYPQPKIIKNSPTKSSCWTIICKVLWHRGPSKCPPAFLRFRPQLLPFKPPVYPRLRSRFLLVKPPALSRFHQWLLPARPPALFRFHPIFLTGQAGVGVSKKATKSLPHSSPLVASGEGLFSKIRFPADEAKSSTQPIGSFLSWTYQDRDSAEIYQ